MFPHNAEVRNKMTVSECRRYINYIADYGKVLIKIEKN
jgi:hypothetical protein